jgi:hypothetical protein
MKNIVKMKNLLKNKKLLFGGAIVLGVAVLSYYHKKGLKVLASQTPATESGADGEVTTNWSGGGLNLTPTATNSSWSGGGLNLTPTATNSSGAWITNSANNSSTLALQNALSEVQKQIAQAPATPKVIVGNTGVANPIIMPTTPILTTPSGIAVTNAGTLTPVGIGGWLTTIQTGFNGAVPKSTILSLLAQMQSANFSLAQNTIKTPIRKK